MSNLFPRYANNQVDNYSTHEEIIKLHPEFLENFNANDQNFSKKPEFIEKKEFITSQIKSYEDNKDSLVPYQSDNTVDVSRELMVLNQQSENKRKLESPNLQQQGHQSDVFTCKFSNDGNYLATAGHDKQILVWDIYNKCTNTMALKGHKNAILDLRWSYDSSKIYTASADKTVSAWDVETQKRQKRFKGHSSFVNCCDTVRRGLDFIISGSDDNTLRLWDIRDKNFVSEFHSKYPVLSVAFNDSADKVYSGGLDNCVKVWDLRKNEIEEEQYMHTDTITGLSQSHDGSYLLSNSMDQTVRCWDIRPFVVGSRCVKIFQGIHHGFDRNLLRVCWNRNGKYITAGSSDKFVYIWDTTTRKVVFKMGGHIGSVNETAFHPKENIIASCSSDKTVMLSQQPDIE